MTAPPGAPAAVPRWCGACHGLVQSLMARRTPTCRPPLVAGLSTGSCRPRRQRAGLPSHPLIRRRLLRRPAPMNGLMTVAALLPAHTAEETRSPRAAVGHAGLAGRETAPRHHPGLEQRRAAAQLSRLAEYLQWSVPLVSRTPTGTPRTASDTPPVTCSGSWRSSGSAIWPAPGGSGLVR